MQQLEATPDIVSFGKIIHQDTATSVIVEKLKDNTRVTAINVSPEARVGDSGCIVELDTGTFFMLPPYPWS